MCNRYRMKGREVLPGEPVDLEYGDGMPCVGVWAGFATRERLDWWMRQPGNRLAQTREAVTEVAERADDTREILWAPVPAGANLLFVVETAAPSRKYAVARMVTTAATTDQEAYFRHGRFPLLGRLEMDGRINVVTPAPAPAPRPRAQGELF